MRQEIHANESILIWPMASVGDLRMLALTVLIMVPIRGLADTENYDLSFQFWFLTTLSLFLSREDRSGQLPPWINGTLLSPL